MRPICRVLPIAPLIYYAHAARRADPDKQPVRACSDAVLMIEITRMFEANFCVYGVLKIWRQLAREGIVTARCTVARLMRRLGLAWVVRGRTVRTTISDQAAAWPLDRQPAVQGSPAECPVGQRPHLRSNVVGLRLCGVRHRCVRPAHRRLAGLTQCSRELRAGCSGTGAARASPWSGQRAGAPLGPRLGILGSTVHSAPGWCKHRAVGRQRRRRLRQRPGGDDQRPVQGGGDPPTRTLALLRGGAHSHFFRTAFPFF